MKRDQPDIFTRMIHSIRTRYAVASVIFLAIAVAIIYMGHARMLGSSEVLVIVTMIVMVLALFMVHSAGVIGPVERMSALIGALMDKAGNGNDPLHIRWNGENEFACLAAAFNALLEKVQDRNVGLAEANLRMRKIVTSTLLELVLMNRNGTVLNVVHCPDSMVPVPGLTVGRTPDKGVWSETDLQSFLNGLLAVVTNGGSKVLELNFANGSRVRRVLAIITTADNSEFPLVMFHDADAGDDATLTERRQRDLDAVRREFPGGEVLVVDDNPSVLKITSLLLRTQRVAAHVADCRKDAIRKFRELNWRLRAVFLDAQLGDETSRTLLAEMRETDPTIPIVVVSGYNREQTDQVLGAGTFDAFLGKPYTLDELKSVLDAMQVR